MASPQYEAEALLAERRREQQALVDLARRFVEEVRSRLPVSVAVVAGSVARGDFNLWSDVDVVLVVEAGLPPRLSERLEVVERHRPGRVQPIAFTPEEFREALRRGNRLVVEAVEAGLVLTGGERLADLSRAEGDRR